MSNAAVASAVAAGRVPSDVSVAYLEQSRDRSSIVAIIFITTLTFLIVGARALSRGILVKRFGSDDGLAVLGLILLIAFTVLCVILIDIGSGRHYDYIQYVMTLNAVSQSEVLDFAAHLIYTTALLLCRMSGLAFYHRICGSHDRFHLVIEIVFGILIVGYLPQIFLIMFHCLPVTGLWPYDWQPGGDKYKCLEWGLVYSVNSSVSLICDILLFGIPTAMLRMLNIPRKRKIQLACIILPGTLVILISIARLVLVILGQWEADESWSYNPMLTVETSEIGGTLIAVSVPGVVQLYDRYILGQPRESSQRSGVSLSRFQNHGSNVDRDIGLRDLDSMAVDQQLSSMENLDVSLKDGHDTGSTDGILGRTDFE